MPIYDYRCTACGRSVEVVHSIAGTGPATCEVCGGAMRKLVSTPAIHFKGSGWAKKDARSAPSGSSATTAGAKDGASGDGKTAGSTDAAPAAGGASGSSTETASSGSKSSGDGGLWPELRRVWLERAASSSFEVGQGAGRERLRLVDLSDHRTDATGRLGLDQPQGGR